ncbi:uncharacterized protein LOC129582955 [Paramacrobiotus metropolitanus]|uniref:uncharacterized protein LOC129582955 n=1 Tax=Paramacrobiotus metropolitanus TaxID=2943436 RepID=UPI0024459781|nr:uncharacterized protein LOC129582955 [Paramacrobiotus metropolitanus]
MASFAYVVLAAVGFCFVVAVSGHELVVSELLTSVDGPFNGHVNVHVNICQCCYDVNEKVRARGRSIVVQPTADNKAFGKDPRVSMDIDYCEAETHLAAGIEKIVLVENGQLTQAGCQVQLRLTKKVVDNVPSYEGSIQSFTLGSQNVDVDALLRGRLKSWMTCRLSYCDASDTATAGRCRVAVGGTIAGRPVQSDLLWLIIKLNFPVLHCRHSHVPAQAEHCTIFSFSGVENYLPGCAFNCT